MTDPVILERARKIMDEHAEYIGRYQAKFGRDTVEAMLVEALSGAPDKRATILACIDVLRGSFGAGRGGEALLQRNDDIASLEMLLDEQPSRGRTSTSFVRKGGPVDREGRPLRRAPPITELTADEIQAEALGVRARMIAAWSGPVVSFDVADPYYLASCDACGWVGSSEACGTDTGGDDSNIYCPRCQANGADCGKVANCGLRDPCRSAGGCGHVGREAGGAGVVTEPSDHPPHHPPGPCTPPPSPAARTPPTLPVRRYPRRSNARADAAARSAPCSPAGARSTACPRS